MGEGSGKKDVSDQLTSEDQLLGAQQKDQQPPPQPPEQQQGGDEDDDKAQGVEMEGDFEGSLHDVDDRRQQQEGDDDAESQEGDDDRIDQQMGQVRAWVCGVGCPLGVPGAWLHGCGVAGRHA
jgi:midasin